MAKNDKVDYEMLYEKYSRRIVDGCLSYSNKNRDLSEDAMQAAFLELFVKISKNETVEDYYNFLFTAAKNHILNHNKKHKKIQLGDDWDVVSDDRYTNQSTEDEFFEQQEHNQNTELLEIILKEVEKKNFQWYYIITEVFGKGRTQREVAKELNMSNEAIYAMVNRIRQWTKRHKLEFLNTLEERQEAEHKEKNKK